jgi:hypothetical protein
MNMKCDKCGNDSRHLVRVLSDEDTINTGTSARGTEQTTAPPPTETNGVLLVSISSNSNIRIV